MKTLSNISIDWNKVQEDSVLINIPAMYESSSNDGIVYFVGIILILIGLFFFYSIKRWYPGKMVPILLSNSKSAGSKEINYLQRFIKNRVHIPHVSQTVGFDITKKGHCQIVQ